MLTGLACIGAKLSAQSKGLHVLGGSSLPVLSSVFCRMKQQGVLLFPLDEMQSIAGLHPSMLLGLHYVTNSSQVLIYTPGSREKV